MELVYGNVFPERTNVIMQTTIDELHMLIALCYREATAYEIDQRINMILGRSTHMAITVDSPWPYTYAATADALRGVRDRFAVNVSQASIAHLRQISAQTDAHHLARAAALISDPQVQAVLLRHDRHVMGGRHAIAMYVREAIDHTALPVGCEEALAAYDALIDPYAKERAHIAALRDEANAREAQIGRNPCQ